jgi:hypothetical protein
MVRTIKGLRLGDKVCLVVAVCNFLLHAFVCVCCCEHGGTQAGCFFVCPGLSIMIIVMMVIVAIYLLLPSPPVSSSWLLPQAIDLTTKKHDNNNNNNKLSQRRRTD